jgi:capsular polysaccharide biosynthesis protein
LRVAQPTSREPRLAPGFVPPEDRARPSFALVARREIGTIVAALVVGSMIGFLLAATRPKQYTASADLFLATPGDSSPGGVADAGFDATRYDRNQAAIISSLPVAQATAAKIKGATLEEVAASVKALPSQETDVVTITATSSDPERAVLLVDKTKEAYQDANRAAAQAGLTAAEKDRQSLEDQLASVGTQIAARPTDVSLTVQRDQIASDLAAVAARAQAYRAEISSGLLGVKLYTSPGLPTAPSSPNTKVLTLFGGLAGLFVVGSLVLLREVLQPRAAVPEVAANRLGSPILAEMEARSLWTRLGLRDARDSGEAYGEALGIVLRQLGEGVPAIGVTAESAPQTEATLRALAAVGSAAGWRVSTLSADGSGASRRGRLARPGRGGEAGTGGLAVATREELAVLVERDDATSLLLVALPQYLATIGTLEVASQLSGVVAVTGPRTPLADLDRFEARLALADVPILGVVFDAAAGRVPALRRRGTPGPPPQPAPAPARAPRAVGQAGARRS